MKKPVKKKPGPKPTGKGKQINVRLLPDILAATAKYETRVGAGSPPEAIRHALVRVLKLEGLL